MAIKEAGKKAVRSDAKKRVFNDRRRRAMREAEKEVRALASSGKQKDAEAKMPQATKAIDKAVKSGIIKKNTAARKKSRLVKAVQKAA